jgi:hypothetical protein
MGILVFNLKYANTCFKVGIDLIRFLEYNKIIRNGEKRWHDEIFNG